MWVHYGLERAGKPDDIRRRRLRHHYLDPTWRRSQLFRPLHWPVNGTGSCSKVPLHNRSSIAHCILYRRWSLQLCHIKQSNMYSIFSMLLPLAYPWTLRHLLRLRWSWLAVPANCTDAQTLRMGDSLTSQAHNFEA
jgi:hypothetical protein